MRAALRLRADSPGSSDCDLQKALASDDIEYVVTVRQLLAFLVDVMMCMSRVTKWLHELGKTGRSYAGSIKGQPLLRLLVV